MTYRFLHVGCGDADPAKIPSMFAPDQWQEVRLDINPAVQPDIVGSLTDLNMVADASFDALYSSHNLEHVFAHEVPTALAEWFRVLRPGGFVMIRVPDIQAVARAVAEGNLEGPLYESPAGPISAADMLWGWREKIAKGEVYMAHRTGFTQESLRSKVEAAGFVDLQTLAADFDLHCVAFKPGGKPVMAFRIQRLTTPEVPTSLRGLLSFLFRKNRP